MPPVNKILRNNRPFSPAIARLELQAEKIKQKHIVALLIIFSLGAYFILKISSIQRAGNGSMSLMAAFFLSSILFSLLFSSIWKTFKALFGPQGRYSFVQNGDMKQMEVGHEEYLWVRAVCRDYPDLQSLVKSLENEKGNQTFESISFLWKIVGRRDLLEIEKANQKILQKLPLVRVTPLDRPLNLGCGITCYVLSPFKTSVANILHFAKIGGIMALTFGCVNFLVRQGIVSKIVASRDLQFVSAVALVSGVIAFFAMQRQQKRQSFDGISPAARKNRRG